LAADHAIQASGPVRTRNQRAELPANSDLRAGKRERTGRHLFYTESEGVLFCVVTAPAHDADRFVVTAYFTTNIKEGVELWKR
jgi:hypothetical protein